MKLADAHLHLIRQGYAEKYGKAWANPHEVELYNTFRRIHSIEYGLVVGYEGSSAYRGNNSDLVKWRKKQPWMRPVAFFQVMKPPSIQILEKNKWSGFVGISLYALNADQAESLNRWPRLITKWLNSHRQIISINARPESLARLEPFLSSLEGCTVLISHLGLPGRYKKAPSKIEVKHKLRSLTRLSKLSYLGVKLSGLYAISDPSHDYPHKSAHPFLVQLYDTFGPKRLYWGSDFSPALEHISFSQTIDPLFQLEWSSQDLQKIMHDNLVNLF